MFLRSTGIVRRVVGGLFYASAADYDVEPRTFHCVTRALRTNGSRSTNALGPRRRRRERRTRTPSTGSENALAMTSSPRLCASFRSRRCSSRYGARRCEVIFDNFIEQKVIHFASLLIPSMARPYSFSFTISWRTWSSKRFPTTMRKLRVLLAQLPFAARAGPVPNTLFPNVERRFAASVFAADVGHSGAALRPAQGPQDLLFRMSVLHHRACLPCSRPRTMPAAPNSTYRWLAFRFLGHSFTSAVALYHELLPLR